MERDPVYIVSSKRKYPATVAAVYKASMMRGAGVQSLPSNGSDWVYKVYLDDGDSAMVPADRLKFRRTRAPKQLGVTTPRKHASSEEGSIEDHHPFPSGQKEEKKKEETKHLEKKTPRKKSPRGKSPRKPKTSPRKPTKSKKEGEGTAGGSGPGTVAAARGEGETGMELGDAVKVRIEPRGRWHLATLIDKQEKEGEETYSVRFPDGDTAIHIPKAQLKPATHRRKGN